MTTLEVVLICTTGVETVITAVWATKVRRDARALLIYASQMAIYHSEKASEYDRLLETLGVWRNAG